MKTVAQLEEARIKLLLEMEEVKNDNSLTNASKKRKINALAKRKERITKLKLFLMEGPTDDFLRKELVRLQNRLLLIQQHRVVSDLPGRREWEKKMDVPKIKEHIANISFLLN